MSISTRITQVPTSAVRKLVPAANAAKAAGTKVYHLNIGDPDIETPEQMLDVLRNWKEPVIRYAPSQGTPQFLDACVSYYHKIGFPFVSKQHMVIGIGASECLQWTFFATCEPGEELLVFEPFYSNYSAIASQVGVTLRAVPTTIENGFHLPTRKEIQAHITPKTKGILYTNPGNPTGTVYTKEEVELLVSIAKENKLFLISDEPYREYAFDTPTVSLMAYVEQIPEYAILLDSLSKRYALCGGRLGIVYSHNTTLMAGIMKLAMARLSGGFIDQAVGAALVNVPDSYLTRVTEEYKKRRDLIYEELNKIPGVSVPKPEGAFYAMVSLPVEDSEVFAKWLLEHYRDNNETVMLAPGEGFYGTPGKGKNQVRIAYILNVQDLKRCMELIRGGLSEYNAKKQ